MRQDVTGYRSCLKIYAFTRYTKNAIRRQKDSSDREKKIKRRRNRRRRRRRKKGERQGGKEGESADPDPVTEAGDGTTKSNPPSKIESRRGSVYLMKEKRR